MVKEYVDTTSTVERQSLSHQRCDSSALDGILSLYRIVRMSKNNIYFIKIQN